MSYIFISILNALMFIKVIYHELNHKWTKTEEYDKITLIKFETKKVLRWYIIILKNKTN